MEITPKLVEQTRRWLTRTIYEFHHSPMGSLSGERFEKWHEDKARDLLIFVTMVEKKREVVTKELRVTSSNKDRKKLCD